MSTMQLSTLTISLIAIAAGLVAATPLGAVPRSIEEGASFQVCHPNYLLNHTTFNLFCDRTLLTAVWPSATLVTPASARATSAEMSSRYDLNRTHNLVIIDLP